MEFEITHSTTYSYGHPAAEAYGEARLTPPNTPSQQILSHKISIDPNADFSSYTDYFGNKVHFFSLPFRHKNLVLKNELRARTAPTQISQQSLDLTVAEARQILASAVTDIFEYLQPTEVVEPCKQSLEWARSFLYSNALLGEALTKLNKAIYEHFQYTQGATDHSTPLSEIWKERKGVCQDFAHVALSILRTAGLPARYVCGYIETDSAAAAPIDTPPTLIGAVATHAWVEVLLPGMTWAALDPTNRQWVNERYVSVSFGRDSRDAAPLRGTFKGSGGQSMEVQVVMRRVQP